MNKTELKQPSSKDVLNLIPCPVCNSSTFNEVLSLSAKEFITGERKEYYDLSALNLTLNSTFSYQKCTECGFVLANPRLKDEYFNIAYNEAKAEGDKTKEWRFENSDIGALYTTYHKYHILSKLLLPLSFFKHRFSKTRNETYSKISLLDFGPGYGNILDLCRVFGIQGTGVDIDENRIAHCKRKGLNVMRPEELDQDKYDIIISTSVVEHVFDLNYYFDFLQTRMHSESILIINGLTPNIINIEKKRGYYTYVSPIEHINLFTKSTLAEITNTHNLSEVSSTRLFTALRKSPELGMYFLNYLIRRFFYFDLNKGSFLSILELKKNKAP